MLEDDARTLADRLISLDPGRRVLCAVAGAPGSGKSTLAERAVEMLNEAEPGCAALLPMDGFHYDDLWLEPAGLRPRKGAPETFDVGGLYHALARLKARDEDDVAVPVFDRAIEIARAGARRIDRTARIIVAEGNYLLLDRAPWDRLAPLWDLTVRIDVPEEELRRRLTGRWASLAPEEIAAKVDGNDLPNGRVVQTESRPADLVLGHG